MTELGKPGGFDPEAEQKAIESTVVGITEISMSRLGKTIQNKQKLGY